MQLTKNIIKFKSLIYINIIELLIKIPKQTNRIWDLSENRWGYKKCN